MKAFLRELLITAIMAVVIFLLVHTTLQTSVVVGASMEPTFRDGERLLVNKAAYFFGDPRRGDVIIFRPPGNRDSEYIKRIIGVPGDTVEVKSARVYVNGEPLKEDYLQYHPQYAVAPTEVNDGSYFVLGDNRLNSSDSHSGLGLIPRQNIVGKAWLYLWPPDSWGMVQNYLLNQQIATAAGN